MKATLFIMHKEMIQHEVEYTHFGAFLYHLECLQSDGVSVVGWVWK